MLNTPVVTVADAELNEDYWVEFGWTHAGEYRRPAYRAQILDKNLAGGKVQLRREIMGPYGKGSQWDEVVHPREDLFIFELPDDLKTDSTKEG